MPAPEQRRFDRIQHRRAPDGPRDRRVHEPERRRPVTAHEPAGRETLAAGSVVTVAGWVLAGVELVAGGDVGDVPPGNNATAAGMRALSFAVRLGSAETAPRIAFARATMLPVVVPGIAGNGG